MFLGQGDLCHFIYDCTHVTWIFPLKQKSDVSIVFPNFCSVIRNQFGVNIKRIRSNKVRNYSNQIIFLYLKKEAIVDESSCVNIS